MISIVTTDAKVSKEVLDYALKKVTEVTFNRVSVDGDTSVCDMCLVMANGQAGNEEILSVDSEEAKLFTEALHKVCDSLARGLAKDGEGATKLLECEVCGAKDPENARIIAKSVICSSLTKAAMFGADANWGRVLCAIGYSGADVDVNKVAVSFESEKGTIPVCENGAGIDFSEEKAKEILLCDDIKIKITLGDGTACATAYGCDLTYEYVKINGDYRT
jgi:glutamate N-acetyltransferase/amino-acid N-acetyltransferase